VVPFDSLKPVKKFTDRKTAVTRIWKAIQALTPTPAPKAATVATKKAEAAKAEIAHPSMEKPKKKAKNSPPPVVVAQVVAEAAQKPTVRNAKKQAPAKKPAPAKVKAAPVKVSAKKAPAKAKKAASAKKR
jgi:hypothetical protein